MKPRTRKKLTETTSPSRRMHLRESATPTREEMSDDSLGGRMDAVRDAVRDKWGDSGLDSCYVYASVIYEDHVIVSKGDDLFSVDYTIDDAGAVSFTSEPVKVKVTYQPIQEAATQRAIAELRTAASGSVDTYTETMRSVATILRPVRESEGAAATGIEWDVILIESGMSQNRNFYSRELLEGAIAKYEGARTFIDHEENQRRFGRSARDVVGFVKDVRGVMMATEANGEARFALAATAVVTKRAFREELLDAYNHGKPDLFGLSHDVKARGKVFQFTDGQPAVRADAIEKVESVDYVVNPAAGGRVLRLVASVDSHAQTSLEDGRMIKKFLEQLKALGRADLVTKLGDNPTEDQVLEALTEALRAAPARSDANPAAATPAAAAATTAAAPVQEAQRSAADVQTMTEARQMIATLRLNTDLQECALPDKLKERIRKRFAPRLGSDTPPSQTEITAAIAEAVEDYGALAEAGVVMPHVAAGMQRVQMGDGPPEKTVKRLDDFFDPSKPATSFREMYVDITGDKRMTGYLREATRLRESLNSTSFDQALGDSITRRMLMAYATPDFANWRAISKVGPVNDFRSQRRIRFGGYGNLSIVNQGQPYLAMTSPTDEEATYSPAKRGGTESITLEMIRNDDVNVIREIPVRIGRAAAQTLYEFVWDFLRTNAAIYDSVALAAAGHGNNLSSTALSWTQWETLRLAMREQTDMSSGKRIGLKARYCIVPPELTQLAWQLFNADRMLPDSSLASTAAPAAPNYAKTQNVQVIEVDYWTDTNNYWVAASTDQTPMLEIGFLDGREEPELFVQDMPNVGSMFASDELTYKIRHIYGGAVMDFRGFAGGIVA